MNPLENVSFNDFKEEVSLFSKTESVTSYEEIDNGFKCLGIMYLNRSDWSEIEEHQALLLLNIAEQQQAKLELQLLNHCV